MRRSPLSPRARRCHTSGELGTEESCKLSMGRCTDPRGRVSPSSGLPTGSSERCQKVPPLPPARSLELSSRREAGAGPCKVGAGWARRPDPRDRSPRPGDAGGEEGGTRLPEPSWDAQTWRLSRAPGACTGAESTRGQEGDVGRSGRELTCRPAGQLRGRLSALRTRPPASPRACPPLPPSSPASPPPPPPPGSESSGSSDPQGWRAPVARTHPWVRAARASFPPPLCASLIPPHPLSPSPHPFLVPSPPSAPANPSSGWRPWASPTQRRAPCAHPRLTPSAWSSPAAPLPLGRATAPSSSSPSGWKRGINM